MALEYWYLNRQKIMMILAAIALPASLDFAKADEIEWLSGVADSDEIVVNRGVLVEAANFGNRNTSSPTINTVPFQAVDFTSSGTLSNLSGLTYNTGESGKYQGKGFAELFDTIAYRSGADPQRATLTGLKIGASYIVQFFYYHNSVNRTVTITDGNGNRVSLSESGNPLYATGTFTATSTRQVLSFDANTGSQFLNAYQLREVQARMPLVLGEVVISEFVASNRTSFLDDSENSPDWIEIWNATDTSVDLDGWYLTDDPGRPKQWPFPSISLRPDAVLLILASGQVVDDNSETDNLFHANFKLDKSGGYLALMKPDNQGGTELAHAYDPYPSPQFRDVAFGLYGETAMLSKGYLATPTPGRHNDGPGVKGFVADTKFSPNRGFYDEPINVWITSATDGATIRYTSDGSIPTLENGQDYPVDSGIQIDRTTIIRAAAFKDGYQATNTDTHTYLFVKDIVEQPARPEGFPTSWIGWDYAMENNEAHLALIADTQGLSQLEAKAVVADALRALPALSLTMPITDWFSPSSGIYHNTEGRGMAWERPCSAEYFFEGDKPLEPGFQVDCGIRLQGFTSRDPNRNPKHSLRLAFRDRYGEAKLEYPLFGNVGPSEFDTIVLRSNSQDGWVYDSSQNRAGQFIRDHWNRRIMELLGQPAPKSNWVHLYLNGLYWGVYNPTERPDASFSQSRHGGTKENYDAIKNHEEILDGTKSAYRALLNIVQKDSDNFNSGYQDLSNPLKYQEVLPFIELTNLADYMIHNMYSAARDWPGNFYMGYDRSGRHGGWWFYDWDNEHGLKGTVNENRTRPHSRDADSPTKFHHALRANPDYRMIFADRIHRAFFNAGPLYVDSDNPHFDAEHPERNRPAALWMEMTSQLEIALIAESARWGDYRKATPYTVHNEFTSLRDSLLRNWFPRRSSIVLQQFQSLDLYPMTQAPVMSLSNGVIPVGHTLTMTSASNDPIYYTINGSDPRRPAGSDPSISADAKIYNEALGFETSSEIRARAFNGTEWSALTEALFITGIPASANTLVISEIMYHASSGTALDFIEVMNISTSKTIDLTNVRFTDGVGFTFPTGTTLAPLSRLVLVENEIAFTARYGSAINIAGQYAGRLDNGGEQIELLDWQGDMIKAFDYGNGGKWPVSADGEGSSLRLLTPLENPPHSNPEFWGASSLIGGTPGMPDVLGFSGNPEGDLDGDGISELFDYVFGFSDSVQNSDSMIRFAIEGEFPLFSFRRALGTTDVTVWVEWSEDLEQWESGEDFVRLVSEETNKDGTRTVVYRTTQSLTTAPTQFLRLRAKQIRP